MTDEQKYNTVVVKPLVTLSLTERVDQTRHLASATEMTLGSCRLTLFGDGLYWISSGHPNVAIAMLSMTKLITAYLV